MKIYRDNMLKFIVILPTLIVFIFTIFAINKSYKQHDLLVNLSQNINTYATLNEIMLLSNLKRHFLLLYQATNNKNYDLNAQNLSKKIKTSQKLLQNSKALILAKQISQSNDANLSDSKTNAQSLYYHFYLQTQSIFYKQNNYFNSIEISPKLHAFIDYLNDISYAINSVNLQGNYVEYFFLTKQKLNAQNMKFLIQFHYRLADRLFLPEFTQKNKILSVLDNPANITSMEQFRNSRLILLKENNSNQTIFSSKYWSGLIDSNLAILNQIAKIAKEDIALEIDVEMKKAQNNVIWLCALLLAMLVILALCVIYIEKEQKKRAIFKQFLQNISNKFDQPILMPYNDFTELLATIDGKISDLILQKNISEETSSTKGNFLTSIFHQINTQLNGIISFLSLLERSKSSAYNQQFIRLANENILNTSSIIHNVLDISNLSKNQILLEKTDFVPLVEFEKITQIYALTAANKNITFISYIDTNLTHIVCGDLAKIKTILLNLINNAINFTKEGGEIEINILLLDYEIKGKSKIYFAVRDTGIGISKNNINFIFDNYFRISDSQSCGLGLSICKEYLKMMDSSMRVVSEINEGSEFSFIIDFDQKEQGYKIPKFDLNIAILTTDEQNKYNEFLQKYLQKLSINFKIFNDIDNFAKENKISPFDAIIMRFEDYLSITRKLENIIILSVNTKILTTLNFESKKIITINEPLEFTRLINAMNQVIAHNNQKDNCQDYDEIFKTIEGIKDQYDAKALIFESDKNYQFIFKYILNDFGIIAEIQSDDENIKDIYYKADFDIIFIDTSKSITKAQNIVSKIKKIEKESGISGVALIAIIDNIKADQISQNIGFDGYITQPIKTENLKFVLDKFIYRKKSSNPNFLQENLVFKNKIHTNLAQNLQLNRKSCVLIFKTSLILNKMIIQKFSDFCDQVNSVTNLSAFDEILHIQAFSVIIIDFTTLNCDISSVINTLNDAKNRHKLDTKTILILSKKHNFNDEILSNFDKIIQDDFELNQIITYTKKMLRNGGEIL